MISSVFVSGRIGKTIDTNFRYVLIERPLVDQKGRFIVDQIPVRMPYFASESWIKEKEGSFVVFKGRIERDEKLGLVIVIEHREIYGPQLKRKKRV